MHLARQNPNACPVIVRWEALFTAESDRTELAPHAWSILRQTKPLTRGLGTFSIGAAEGAHFKDHRMVSHTFNARRASDEEPSRDTLRHLQRDVMKALVPTGNHYGYIAVDFDPESIKAADDYHAQTITVTNEVDRLEILKGQCDILIPSIAYLVGGLEHFVELRTPEPEPARDEVPDAPALPAL